MENDSREILQAIQKTNEEIQATNLELVKTNAGITSIARSLEAAVAAGGGAIGSGAAHNGSRVSLGHLFTVVGALAMVGGFVIASIGLDLSTHQDSGAHPKIATRVEGMEKILFGEQDRNSDIEDRIVKIEEREQWWRTKHDREVILINTSQAIAIEYEHAFMCVLWARVAPELPCPRIPLQPRIQP